VPQYEDLIVPILKHYGIDILGWIQPERPKFGLLRFCDKSGAIELDGVYLKLYLYHGSKQMEIYNNSLANPDSLEKLRTTLADQRRAINCVSV